jgi:uncharacterized membrane protein YidH (DUF202 family)
MSGKKLLGIVLIALGAVLVYLGYTAAQSVQSQFVQAWSGAMSNRTMIYYTAGAVCLAVGAFLALFSRT